MLARYLIEIDGRCSLLVGGSPTFAWSFADMARCLHAIMTIIFDGDDAETIKKRYGDDDA